MVAAGMLIGVIVLAGGLLALQSWYAHRRGLQVARWRLTTVMIWALLWAIERVLSEGIDQGEFFARSDRWRLVAATVGACLLAYGIIWAAMAMRKPHVDKDINRRIDEIGKRDSSVE